MLVAALLRVSVVVVAVLGVAVLGIRSLAEIVLVAEPHPDLRWLSPSAVGIAALPY
jgi:hypothetical protein